MVNSITDEQRAYIIAHKDDRPISKVLEAIGVSRSTYYNVLRNPVKKDNSAELEKQSKREHYISVYYPDTSSTEIAKVLGICPSSVVRIAKRLGVHHSEAFNERNSLVGKRFFRTVVVAKTDKRYNNCMMVYECHCDCGNVHYANTANLLSGRVKSCGCYKKEWFESHKTHGDSQSRLHKIWRLMKNRCVNKKSPNYKNYGNRGISVCQEWLTDYAAFQQWSLQNGYNDSLTIDRIDNDGDYCPENCRWVTRMAQSNNTRQNRFITYNGKTQTMMQWSRELGINYSTFRYHVRQGNFPPKDKTK